jgi:hypothetical protein
MPAVGKLICTQPEVGCSIGCRKLNCPKVDRSGDDASRRDRLAESTGGREVIADHFEKLSSIYRKQILKMIADHFSPPVRSTLTDLAANSKETAVEPKFRH